MPGKIKVKVLAGRNLPVMDRASDTTDAFVEIKFGSVTHKTDVCRKSLNPHWSSTEWYRFEVDESELQDEPLQLRLMDHDTYSANDAIGKVVISLAPLLARVANDTKGGTVAPHGGAMMSGWIPVFDTMHGIRGELNVIVKVELFSDFNKYKTSSCGVQFFHCPMIPPGYKVQAIHGFVEELVVNDDPEYQWIDKIRTPRASNEARQVAFIKLSNQVQRLVGLKAAELGANAVVGYQQDFDLEGEAGVVARAIGTAVSITPQPMSSQPPSMPPCTQQQLNKYLDILSNDHETSTDLNEYFQTHQDELQKLLYILNPKTASMLDESENADEDEKNFDLNRQASTKGYTGNYSIYQSDVAHNSMKHLSDDQTDLNRLLNRNDDDDSMGPLKTIKKLKTSLFRLSSIKSRKSDKGDDTVSIKSNSSDTSRISLTDFKIEFKKLARLKKPKFRKAFANKLDEGVGMASILARSVIHAHTSLACIAETQDSENSPSSTLRRTSESQPNINISDEEAPNKNAEHDETACSENKKLPAIQFSSMTNISIEGDTQENTGRQRKISESCPSTPVAERQNFLKLPDDIGYFGSISSALSADSSEVYTSSEEEDEDSSDQKSDMENYETTSSVVNSVMNHNVNPAFIAQMERKLSIMDSVNPDSKDIKTRQESSESSQKETSRGESKESSNEHEAGTTRQISPEASTSAVSTENTFVEPKSHNLHFKFHNPFTHKKISKSISAPSSPVEQKGFVYRSSYKIKRQLSKISKSSMIKSLSHYSLLPKRKHSGPKPALSQPSSSSDVPSKAPSETVLGSAFLSYSDLLSLDKEGIEANNRLHKSDEFPHHKVSMYIGSEPASRASVSGLSSPYHGKDDYHPHEETLSKKRPSIKPIGLIHTAMETILMDKVQSLLVPTSPNPAQESEQKFFDDVNEKLEKVEEARNRIDSENEREINHKTELKPVGLIHTAMETILLDKVQSLIVPTSPNPSQESKNKFFDDGNGKLEKAEEARNRKDSENEHGIRHVSELKPVGLIHTAMETILMDKVQGLLVPTSPNPSQESEQKFSDDVNEKIEKVEEARNRKDSVHEREINHETELKPVGLIHTAMETILLDKVQSLIAPTSPNSSQKSEKNFFDDVNEKLEKVQEARNRKHSENEQEIQHVSELKPVGLIHTAMETILLDKVQSLIAPTSPNLSQESKNKFFDDNNGKFEKTEEARNRKDSENEHGTRHVSELKPVGLIHTAMETILMDKVQGLLAPTSPNPSEDIDKKLFDEANKKFKKVEETRNKKLTENEHEISHETELKPVGLIHTAVLDKVQNVIVPTSPNPSQESENKFFDDVNGKLEKAEEARNRKDTENEQEKRRDTQFKPVGFIHTAMNTILIDKVQSLLVPTSPNPAQNSEKILFDDFNGKSKNVDQSKNYKDSEKTDLKTDNDKQIPIKSQTHDKDMKNKNDESADKKDKKLIRQDSIDSLNESDKMSKEIANISPKVSRAPMLQHFHPLLSGPKLETIPSLPETSLDCSQSIDGDSICGNDNDKSECSNTNQASVCDNSHAACGVDRERERDRDREREKEKGSPRHARHESYGNRDGIAAHAPNSSLENASTPLGIHRRSSDSDLSITPKGGSLNTSLGNSGSGGGAILRPSMNSNNLEMLEYPFLTMSEYPPGFIVHIGGTVCARSVKLMDGGESSSRAAWWAELRTELRAHARALRCNAVIAYSETAAICEDVCVLSASGTAAVIDLEWAAARVEPCGAAHVPYSPGAGPYRAELSVCSNCRRARVPAVLLATCAKPASLAAYSAALPLTAVAARARRAAPAAEPGARDISDQLPFLEYELHKLLLAKLRMQGANALFSLTTQIAVGERCVMAIASGQAVKLAALPPPTPPRIKATENDKEALEIQKALWDAFTANKAANGYDAVLPDLNTNGALPETEGERDEAPALDLCSDKDACVLELDEAEDVETARVLATRRPTMHVFTAASRAQPGAPPQAFAQVWRARLALAGQGGGASIAGERHVARALDGVAYKLRRLRPCALLSPRIQLELPEDEIQLVVSGAAIRLADPSKPEPNGDGANHSADDDDIFALDEEQLTKGPEEEKAVVVNGQAFAPAPGHVSLTPLGALGAGGARRVCALRLLFVRETTAVRELGGLSGFLHTFTCEVLAIVRAYTAALGGNALTSFYLTQLMLQDNAHKNQGQCLLSVGGDVVHITY